MWLVRAERRRWHLEKRQNLTGLTLGRMKHILPLRIHFMLFESVAVCLRILTFETDYGRALLFAANLIPPLQKFYLGPFVQFWDPVFSFLHALLSPFVRDYTNTIWADIVTLMLPLIAYPILLYCHLLWWGISMRRDVCRYNSTLGLFRSYRRLNWL